MTPDEARANAARRRAAARAGQPKPNPDGTYGQPPEDMMLNPQTNQMTSRELMQNALPTSRTGAFAGGFMQGYSLDAVDEASGAIGGDFMRERARAQLDANAEDFPATETFGRVVGAVVSPVNKLIGPARTFGGALRVGATYGGVEGFMSGEGGGFDRLKNAGLQAGIGSLFGGMTDRVGRVPTIVRRAFTRADKSLSSESLKGAKNAAYAAVRRSGFKFKDDDMIGLWSSLDDLAKDPRWDLDEIAEIDRPALDALRVFQRRAEAGSVSLNNLDKTRQKLWDSYSKSDHPFILEAISELDGLIGKYADANDLIKAAREANARYAKSQLLDNAFRKARLQTASTGSGGNILNKYRQAVTRIITTPREAKWFSPEEIAVMERFVEGDDVENVLRRVGKLAPGGNGLMQAIMVYGAFVDPAALTIGAVGQAAKSSADRKAIRGAQDIRDTLASGVDQATRSGADLRRAVVGGAAAGGSLAD